MLQSAIFSDLQARDVGSASSVLLNPPRRLSHKGHFARLAFWSRALLVRNELEGLSGHLLRDIGMSDCNED